MTLRNINTGEEVTGDFHKVSGFWQQDEPRMISYHESQWVPVEEVQ